MTSGNLPVRKTIQDTITVSELEISVIPRSEARQSLLNHPMRGPKIRKMILSFYKRTAPRMTKDQLAEKINRRFFSDDISEEYFAVTAIEIKQYRNAAAVQYAVEPSAEEKGAYYEDSDEVNFYLDLRKFYGLSNHKEDLAQENPALLDAVEREGNEEISWGEWAVQLSMTSSSAIQSRTPSSVTVRNTYCPFSGGLIVPVQRTLKLSAPTASAGAPPPHSKSIFASTRFNTLFARFLPLKYSASSPGVFPSSVNRHSAGTTAQRSG